MPKTIAITPSWYWPRGTARVTGVPPYRLDELLVTRWARQRPEDLALVDDQSRLSFAQLDAMVTETAAALRARAGEGPIGLCAGRSVEGAVLLLAILRSGLRCYLIDPGAPSATPGVAFVCADEAGAAAAAATGAGIVRLGELAGAGGDAGAGVGGVGPDDPVMAMTSGADVIWHSNRSLLGSAVSLGTFLGTGSNRPWLCTAALSTWEGICGLSVPLAAGIAAVPAPPGPEAIDLMAREGVGVSFWTLDDAFAATREHKRLVKGIRGVQDFMVVTTGRLFDPDQRRRVGKMFDTPALTMFGLPETGPIFASHPSWYLDESVGIPLSNSWVVPVDPRSGEPIPTLWELVESAMVTVWSPSMFVAYDGEQHPERFRDGRFLTGIVASSDANGMIYLLPD